MKEFFSRFLIRHKILLTGTLIFIITALLLSINLNKPFYGEHDWNGARYGNIARNYLRYGFWETKFGQIENSGFTSPEKFKYFTHYPQLLPILISLSYKIFNISEWSTRLVPLFFTSGLMVIIYLIGQIVSNSKIGILASLLVLLTPQVLYFGKNPVHEPLVTFFVSLALIGYLKYTQNKLLRYKAIFYIGIILAEFTTWAGYFLLPALTLVLLLKKQFNQIKKLIPFYIVSFGLFFLHLMHTYSLTGQFLGGDLSGAFLQRVGLSEAGKIEGLDFFSYILRIRLWLSSLYGTALLLLSLLWTIINYKRLLEKNNWIVLVLLVFGSLYLILFPNSSYIHNYLTFYFLPFIAISSALSLNYFLSFFRKAKSLLCIIILVLIFLGGFNKLAALNESHADELAWMVGKEINKNTKPNEVILITPIVFVYSAEKFLLFYSDRNLVYSKDYKVPDYDRKAEVDVSNQILKLL